MNASTILIILLILLLVGAVPNWHGYGYAPSGIVGTLLIIVVVLMVLGRI